MARRSAENGYLRHRFPLCAGILKGPQRHRMDDAVDDLFIEIKQEIVRLLKNNEDGELLP